MGWTRASCKGGGGSAGGAAAGGKVTGWTIRFLALPEPRSLFRSGVQRQPPSDIERPLSPSPLNPTPFLGLQSRRQLFKASSCPPEPESEGGYLGSILPTTRSPTGAGAPAPTQSGGRYGVVEPTVSAAGRELPFKGVGGAAFHFQLSLLPTPPQVSERRVPARARGGWVCGGAAWAAGCARTRACPGAPALLVFGERAGPLPPAPYNPHVSKGG